MNRPKLSGAISGNHDLRYPYCAEILDTQAVLNDTHVKCPISNGHSLRVIVLNRMKCDLPQSASLRRRSHRIERREAVIQSTGIQLTLDLAYRLLKIAAVTRPRHRLRQLVVRCISAWRKSLVFNGKLVTPDFAESSHARPRTSSYRDRPVGGLAAFRR